MRRRRRRLDRRHAPSAREAAGARVLRLPFNLGIGGAVQAGFVYALEHGYDYMVQVDGDGQHDPAEIDELRRRAWTHDPSVDMVCGSRFLTRRLRYPAPISRRTGIHIFAFLLSRIVAPARHRPDLRASGSTTAARSSCSPRDYPHDYPEVEAVLMLHHHRLRMREVPVRMFERGGGVLLDQLGQVGLLHDQGAARAVRRPVPRARPVPEPGDARAGRRGARGSDGQPDPDRRDPRRRRRCCSSCSSWSAAGGCWSATRCCGCFSAVVLLGLAVWRDALEQSPSAVGIAYPPNALFFVAFGFVLVLLLHFSVAVSRLADQTKVLAQRARAARGAPRARPRRARTAPRSARAPRATAAAQRLDDRRDRARRRAPGAPPVARPAWPSPSPPGAAPDPRARDPAPAAGLLVACALLSVAWASSWPRCRAPTSTTTSATSSTWPRPAAGRTSASRPGRAGRASSRSCTQLGQPPRADRHRRRPPGLPGHRAAALLAVRGQPAGGRARRRQRPNPVGQNPPLYYGYEAIPYWITRWTELPTRLLFMRLANLPLYLLIVAFTWLAAGEVFGRRRRAADDRRGQRRAAAAARVHVGRREPRHPAHDASGRRSPTRRSSRCASGRDPGRCCRSAGSPRSPCSPTGAGWRSSARCSSCSQCCCGARGRCV